MNGKTFHVTLARVTRETITLSFDSADSLKEAVAMAKAKVKANVFQPDEEWITDPKSGRKITVDDIDVTADMAPKAKKLAG